MKMLITVDGKPYHVEVQILGEDSATPAVAAAPSTAIAAPSSPAASEPPTPGGGGGGGGDVESPIAGNVLEVLVKAGDTVKVNDTLIVLEAMKMESNVASPYAGTVKSVNVKAGEAVTAHHVLVSF